ncbi:MAG: hypothetical protein ABI844_01315, partial [Saprospiraceae bacterium]
ALNNLPCRHLLIIMDCCFSGAFKWSSGTRNIGFLMPKQIYKERFDRFVHDPAWQVITSAAYDQKAMDFMVQDRPTGQRGEITTDAGERHSPFAYALFEALAGEADTSTSHESDGLITATELYSFIRDQVEPSTIEMGQQARQTPGFFPLSKHDKGEFIFLHPRHRLNLPPRPSRSPYKGLLPYDESDADLFYGRGQVLEDLKSRLLSQRLLVLSGISGSGKTSIVMAGLIPWLRKDGYNILPVVKPGDHPISSLDQALSFLDATDTKGAILVVDQLEEVVTLCKDIQEHKAFFSKLQEVINNSNRIHAVLITVRSGYETQFSMGAMVDIWQAGLYTLPPFSLEDLKEAALMPTLQEVIIFDPPELVENIVGEAMVAQGAIPLLSNTLDLLYRAYISSGRIDRALTQSDYEKLGGVVGIMHQRADTMYNAFSPDRQSEMRKIFLRMISVEDDLAGRRVPITSLNYSVPENQLVSEVINDLVNARLIVLDTGYLEPAHPALVRTWKTLLEWVKSFGRDTLLLGERLGKQSDQYAMNSNVQLLWNDNPNLANASRLLKESHHLFNAQEVYFVQKSIARNLLKSRIIWAVTISTIIALSALSIWAITQKNIAQTQREIAQKQTEIARKEKDRAILSLFEGLSLNMNNGDPGSLCPYGLCEGAPAGDSLAVWQSLGMLPYGTPGAKIIRGSTDSFENVQSEVFVAARQFGEGHVLAYAHDGLTRDVEISYDSDNLLFAQNALAWLTPRNYKENCPQETMILVWNGTFTHINAMQKVQHFIESRGWKLKVTTSETLEQDLTCGSVFWYLSDWYPPADFSTTLVPKIVKFVQQGGGLLLGGLGWSYTNQYQGSDTIYSGNSLGKPFGLLFTSDYFQPDRSVPIKLLQK